MQDRDRFQGNVSCGCATLGCRHLGSLFIRLFSVGGGVVVVSGTTFIPLTSAGLQNLCKYLII